MALYHMVHKGGHVFVVEIPNCTFEDVQICLMTKNPGEVDKVKRMLIPFKETIYKALKKSPIIVGN